MVLPENVEGFQNGAGVGGAARTGGAVPVADVPQSGRDDAVSRAAVSQVASADLAAGPHSSRANPDPLDGRADAPSAFSSQQPPALCALVTGATGGIGRELCAQLARECGTLALVGRDRGKLEELAKDLAERFDVDTHVFVVDFARPGEVDALASQVQAANLQVETPGTPTCACANQRHGAHGALPRVRARHGGARAWRHPQRGQRGGVRPRAVHVHVLRLEGVRPVVLKRAAYGAAPVRRACDRVVPRACSHAVLGQRRRGRNGVGAHDHQRPARGSRGYPGPGLQPLAVLPGRAGEGHRVRQPPRSAHLGSRCGVRPAKTRKVAGSPCSRAFCGGSAPSYSASRSFRAEGSRSRA